MKDFDKDVIDALVKNKPGKGNIEEKKDTIKDEVIPTDYIVMIVDRSGSMASIKEDAEGGINSFIDEQKKVGKALFTMIEFDNIYDVVHEETPMEQVSQYKLRPRGSTALMDAIGRGFANVDDMKIEENASKIGVIVTDGGENASREWTRKQIFKRIEELKEKGWEFIFLAANQDALETGSRYGFGASTTLNFDEGTVGKCYAVASTYAMSHRSMGNVSPEVKKLHAMKMFDEVLSDSEELSSLNVHKSSDAQNNNANEFTDEMIAEVSNKIEQKIFETENKTSNDINSTAFTKENFEKIADELAEAKEKWKKE